MKRAVTGSAHRGPVGVMRQRRTIRLMQILLVLIGAGIMMFAGYSYGRVSGYEAARRESFEVPREPSNAQTIALVVLGAIPIGIAFALERAGLASPIPARLDELAGRAEQAAVERAERVTSADGD